MTAKRFEQVQRFIAARKIFWVWGTLNISEAQQQSFPFQPRPLVRAGK